MTLRQFLNAILAFIGSESMTDEEYESLPDGLLQEYTKVTYDALRGVIVTRETVSVQAPKLKAYFRAKGVDFEGEKARIPSSQIFVGGALG